MKIDNLSAATPSRRADRRQPAKSEAANPASKAEPGTALVPVAAPVRAEASRSTGSARADTAFVAHLIATAQRDPQTLRLRQATSTEATSRYTASSAIEPHAYALSRTI